MDALLLSRERFATVEHNYVYAILGIVESGGSWQQVDYQRDFLSLCLDVFKYILKTEGNLDVLTACELRNHYETGPIVSSEWGENWVALLIFIEHRKYFN